MESRAITDRQITASSEHNSESNDVHSAKNGRLHFHEITSKEAGAWVADANDVNQWLQIDLIGQYIVTRVATQGRNSSTYQQWVTRYKLQFGDDKNNLQYYRQQGQTTDKVKLSLAYLTDSFESPTMTSLSEDASVSCGDLYALLDSCDSFAQ